MTEPKIKVYWDDLNVMAKERLRAITNVEGAKISRSIRLNCESIAEGYVSAEEEEE